MTPPKRIENRCSNENLYKNVHSSTIDSSQKWKRPSNWLTNKQSCDTCCNMNEQCYANWNNPDIKCNICMIPFIWHIQNVQIHRNKKQITTFWDLGKRKMRINLLSRFGIFGGVTKMFWNRWWWLLLSTVKKLNATELYTLKWLNGKFYVTCIFPQ